MKKLLSVVLILSMLCGTVSYAKTGRAANVQSIGTFVGINENGDEVVLTAADFEYLAEEIDILEESYNSAIAVQKEKYEKEIEDAYNRGKADMTGKISPTGMSFNLSVGETNSNVDTYAQIPIPDANGISFKVYKHWYGQIWIYLYPKTGGEVLYHFTGTATQVNEVMNIVLDKNYQSIKFRGAPHGGGSSTITITDINVW